MQLPPGRLTRQSRQQSLNEGRKRLINLNGSTLFSLDYSSLYFQLKGLKPLIEQSRLHVHLCMSRLLKHFGTEIKQ